MVPKTAIGRARENVTIELNRLAKDKILCLEIRHIILRDRERLRSWLNGAY